jgi:hypothetical protein
MHKPGLARILQLRSKEVHKGFEIVLGDLGGKSPYRLDDGIPCENSGRVPSQELEKIILTRCQDDGSRFPANLARHSVDNHVLNPVDHGSSDRAAPRHGSDPIQENVE